MKFRKRLKRNIVWSVAWSFDRLLNILPRGAAVALGSWIGLTAWAILRRDRYRIDLHLRLAYKDRLSDRERRQIGRNFFVNTGKNIVDVIRVRKHLADEIMPLVTIDGLDHFDKAYNAGKGLVGITGHLGNFELLAACMAARGYKIGVIGREQADDRIDRWIVEHRKSAGLVNFATTESPRRVLAWLREGNVLGVLIDTDSVRIRGRFVPFFGRMSNTPVGQTILGLRTGAAFMPMACVRTGDNRYKVIFKPPIEYDASLPEDELVQSVTLKCAKALEEIIDTYRDQWIWLHNRWHTRPENPA
jgi:Kdo2-lipid IVA lauroyltransferase/acyltransferase